MDMDLPHSPRHSSTIRTSNGCWTCRIRRKKCDGKYPACEACAALYITCHHDQDRPEWMDGGLKQEEMAERVKREVKENAHRRRGERAIHTSSDRVSAPGDLAAPICDLLKANLDTHSNGIEPCPKTPAVSPQRGADCTLSKAFREGIPFGRSETVFLMFYLENLFPFLFPFYRPSILQGGRAWILEMMISSAVVRQAILCQSSYFLSLARGTPSHDVIWETVLTQTRDAFGALRQSLQIIEGSDMTKHLHGAVRIMASIMQVQRFEIAVLSFKNCQAHLNAALALFRQLLDSAEAIEPAGTSLSFNTVISHLGPPSGILPPPCVQVPSAEQAAFRFSSALLILDDIVASTALQERPRLYEYHSGLLGNTGGSKPPIDLEAVIGCQNWVLLQVGEIAMLDAWKQQRKRTGSLDVMELVYRATAIKDSLEAQLTRLESDSIAIPKEGNSLLDAFTADYGPQSNKTANQSSLVTRIWAHAALLYLFVVVSGWQPASVDVRYHAGRIFELLTLQISPPALLRTMVWPFCVAGCLAEPAQEVHLRGMVQGLQPPSVFGTVRKALEIMENVWRKRGIGDAAIRDFAMCFRDQGDLVLLV